MKKLFGILLTLISFVFLIWCFLAHPSTLVVRLLFNFVGFMGLIGGLFLAGVNLIGFYKSEEPYERKEAPKTKKKNEPKKTELKKFENEDHDRYLPK